MNFYPHHISDFNNATRHLTRVERSVYRDSIELYYDTESALTGDFDTLSRKLLCRIDEEKQALKDVLNEFYCLQDGEYFHARCDAEIAKYRANKGAKARAGIASAEARRLKKVSIEQNLTPVEFRSTNQEPITNNQEPYIKHTKNKPEEFTTFWNHYPRKTNKPKAEQAFKKIRSDELDSILFNIDQLVSLGAWDLNDKQFIPHASTYLNNRRWEDEVIPKSKPRAATTGTRSNTLENDLTDQSWANFSTITDSDEPKLIETV